MQYHVKITPLGLQTRIISYHQGTLGNIHLGKIIRLSRHRQRWERRMSTLTDPLIADYLRRNGFTDTLRSFESHVGVQPRINYEKLEDIIHDRTAYMDRGTDGLVDSGANINNKSENSHLFNKWSGIELHSLKEIDHGSLFIDMSLGRYGNRQVVFLSASDKSICIYDVSKGQITNRFTELSNTVTKCCYPINDQGLVSLCGMDGVMRLVQLCDEPRVITSCQLHNRLITDFEVFVLKGVKYIVSIGWDKYVKVHKLVDEDTKVEFVSQFELLTNATSVKACQTPSGHLLVLVTRMDSSLVSILTPFLGNELREISRISLNDAQFSTHAFTAMSMDLSFNNNDSICNADSKIVVSTSDVPYMRLIVAKFPTDLDKRIEQQLPTIGDLSLERTTESSQSLISVIDRDVVLLNLSTNAPQDKLSQSKIQYSYEDKGVWIFSECGEVLAIDLYTGDNVCIEKSFQLQRIKCAIAFVCPDGCERLLIAQADKSLVVVDSTNQ